MKVVFINPWSQDEEGVKWTSEYQTNYWRNAYLGLVQIATYTRSLAHDVTIIDFIEKKTGKRNILMLFLYPLGTSGESDAQELLKETLAANSDHS